ncbi:MAG: ABC transporter permease [Bdellovibrionales bacterium]|nr:ABC transporter permease [Bdellovibrionales bacterium]
MSVGDEYPRIKRYPPWELWPALGWLGLFFIVPLAIVAIYSLGTRGTYGGVVLDFSFANYLRAFDGIYIKIFLQSLLLAGSTTLACLLMGYPVAYVMATSRPAFKNLLVALTVLPFWTNFIVRVYAIRALLPEGGQGGLAVAFGMLTNYLPFMILPLFVAIDRFDFTLIEAARDLGAKPWQVVFRVLIPQTQSGIITGCVFVFTPALGEFVIPDILGGAKSMLMGNLITEQFLKTRDWPFGSALSLLMMSVVTLSLIFYIRSSGETGKAAHSTRGAGAENG